MLFRYAPTPSGFLHIGNAVNFVLNYVLAKKAGAQILLRIDDLDAGRKRPEYVEDVFRTLDFLGLSYDLGPTGPDDFERHWSQRHRLELYRDTLDQLRKKEKLFACKLSRKQLQAYGERYPSECRWQGLSLDEPDVALRVKVEESERATAGLSDFIVRRRDGVPAYQVASLTDDIHFGVTHLVRGDDLWLSTAMQRYLATVLGGNYALFLETLVWHHPIIRGNDGHKLSKSAGSTSIRSMRSEGLEAIYQLAGTWLGLPSTACGSLTDLVAWDITSFEALNSFK